MTEAPTPTQTTRQNATKAPESAPRPAGVTPFDAALLATLVGATGDQHASDRAPDADRAQQLRDAKAARRDPTRPDIRGVARSEEAGVLRMATVTELATAELRGEGEQPAASPQPKERQRAGREPSGASDQNTRESRAGARDGASSERSGRSQPKPADGPGVATARGTPAAPSGTPVAAHVVPGRAAAPVAASTTAGIGAGVSAVRAAATQVRGGATSPQPAAVGGAGRVRGSVGPRAKADAASTRPHVLRHAKAFQAQLARGLAAALKKGDGLVTLRLRPSSLGRLTIDLRVTDAQVTARIQASTDAARGLLESAGGELRDALAARGLNLHRLDVQVVDPAQTQQPSEHGAQHDASPDQHAPDDPPREGRSAGERQGASGPVDDDGDLDDVPLDDLARHASIALGVDVVV